MHAFILSNEIYLIIYLSDINFLKSIKYDLVKMIDIMIIHICKKKSISTN